MMPLLFACLAAMSILLLWLGLGIRRIGAVSPGTPIPDSGGTALLLIDLQEVFWDQGPYSKAAKAQAEPSILEEVRVAKAQDIPVIDHSWRRAITGMPCALATRTSSRMVASAWAFAAFV